MNVHTFRDAVSSRRTALANEIEDDDDDREVGQMRREIEGEEEESAEKFNEDGVAIEPFNLRNEKEIGYFDENQNFVFKKERGELDAWISGLDEETIEAAIGEAALAEKKRALKRQMEEEAEDHSVVLTPLELKVELLSYMQAEETIASSLRRLGGRNLEQPKDLKGARRRPTENNTTKLSQKEKQAQQMAIAKQNRKLIERVTEIADQLIAHGLSAIYDMSYEAIRVSTIMWEYKGADGVVYGPYTSQQISEWKYNGYMTGETAVMIRKVKPRVNILKPAINVSKKISSIYDDDEEEEKETEGPAAKKAKLDELAQPAATEEADSQYDEWRNSDEIDFGAFVNLDESTDAIEKRRANKQKKSNETSRNNNQQGLKKGNNARRNDFDDEDDEDEDEDGPGHGRHDEDDDDEDDEDD